MRARVACGAAEAAHCHYRHVFISFRFPCFIMIIIIFSFIGRACMMSAAVTISRGRHFSKRVRWWCRYDALFWLLIYICCYKDLPFSRWASVILWRVYKSHYYGVYTIYIWWFLNLLSRGEFDWMTYEEILLLFATYVIWRIILYISHDDEWRYISHWRWWELWAITSVLN